jgi:hypothetical protein
MQPDLAQLGVGALFTARSYTCPLVKVEEKYIRTLDESYQKLQKSAKTATSVATNETMRLIEKIRADSAEQAKKTAEKHTDAPGTVTSSPSQST